MHTPSTMLLLCTLLDPPQLMNAPAKSNNKDLKEIREQQLVTRSQRLRGVGRIIPESGFKMRKEFLAAKVFGCTFTKGGVDSRCGRSSWLQRCLGVHVHKGGKGC